MRKRTIALLALVAVWSAVAFADFKSDGGYYRALNQIYTIKDDTSEAFSVDSFRVTVKDVTGNFARTQLVLRCVAKPVANDSTFAWIVVRNRLGDNGTIANVCSTRFTAAAETWFSFSALADADTTTALGGHFGDQWIFDVRIADSTAVATAVELTTYQLEAWIKARKY